jgi:hypothetical protein
MAGNSGVDVFCQVVLAHELWIVEGRIVGGEEEDAGEEELIVGAFALSGF